MCSLFDLLCYLTNPLVALHQKNQLWLQYLQEYLNETESMDQSNEFIQTKEGEKNAVQEQSPEEIPPHEEAEDGEEVGEEDSEGSEASEESET